MVFNTILNESSELDLEIGLRECAEEPGIEAALQHVYEAEENWNKIQKSIGLGELRYYEENGKDKEVYTEADMGSFVGTIKRFFIAVIEKIKGLFKKFKAIISSFIMKDKKFVSTYRSKIAGHSAEYKGYKFTPDAIAPGAKLGSIQSTVSGATAEVLNNTSEFDEKMRGVIIGDGKEYTASEFSKELYAKLRGGETSKTSSSFSGDEQLKILSDTQNNLKAATKSMTELEKAIKAIIKAIEAKSKAELNKDKANGGAVKTLNDEVRAYKAATNFAQIANGALITALKARNRQARAICVTIVGGSKKKVDTNESTVDLPSNLDNIEFI